MNGGREFALAAGLSRTSPGRVLPSADAAVLVREARRDRMIGILIVAHDSLPDALARTVAHVLGSRPPQFETFPVRRTDDPLDLLPAARAQVARLDTGDGVLVFTDLYGASPSNLAKKLVQPGRVEALAGVNLPMLVRAATYRSKGLETMVRKAVSGGCEGVVHIVVDPTHAATRT